MKKHNSKKSVAAVSIKFGIVSGVASILFFLAMKLLGLAHISQLRFFNAAIIIIGTYLAMRNMKSMHRLRYLNSLGLSMLVAGIGYTLLSGFLFIYLKFDTTLMSYYVEHAPMGQYLTPFYVGFWVASEGIAMQPILGMILIEYMKGYTGKHKFTNK